MKRSVPKRHAAVYPGPVNGGRGSGAGRHPSRLQRTGPLSFVRCLVLVIPLLATSLSASAREAQDLADVHNRCGLRLLEQGQTRSAVEEFVRSLLIDPGNVLAATHLKSLGNDERALSHPQRLQVARFLDLINYLAFLNERLRDIHLKNTEVTRFIKDNDPEAETLALERLDNVSENTEWPGSFAGTGRFLKEMADIKDFRMDAMNARLQRRKDEDLRALKDLQKTYAFLWAIKQKIITRAAEKKHAIRSSALTHEIQNLKDIISDKDRQLEKQGHILNALSNQIRDIRQDYSELQYRFIKANQKINTVTKKLAGLTLEIYEKDRLRADQTRRINVQAGQLVDAQERLNLVQRIMQEKDQQLQSLESTGASPRHRDAAQASRPAGSESSARGQDRMMALEKEFLALQHQYQKASRNLKDKDAVIEGLRGNLISKELTIAELQRVFLSKDLKITELSGVVEIYKGRLSRTTRLLAEKEDMLSRLEKKLEGLNFSLEHPEEGTDADAAGFPVTEVRIIDALAPWPDDVIYDRTKEDVHRLLGNTGVDPQEGVLNHVPTESQEK